ncbi:MAG: cytidylate kinase-like family protein [Opitutaceae bacterium]|nr:cytidylate kinase-like family protein [Opitutaceae bacterium]
MHALPVFEKAEAYLQVQLTRSGPGGTAHPAGPFVTISRESGAGGTTLARSLAERLPRDEDAHPWTVYSANLIEEMLRTNELPVQLARFLPEDRISEIDSAVGELVGLHPSLWVLVEKTNQLVRQLAQVGHTIVLGRGANFATSGIHHGVHVRLVAPAKWRAERTARWLGLDVDSAAIENARRDAARQRYVRATFAADVADATAYDLVINTAQVPVDTSVDIIAGFVRAHQRNAADMTLHR